MKSCKRWKNHGIIGFPLKRRLCGKEEAPISSSGLTFFDISASWSDFEKPKWRGSARSALIFSKMWRLSTPHLALCFTICQRLRATLDDQNDGLVFYEALQDPMRPWRGPKRLPQVARCASKRPPAGLDLQKVTLFQFSTPRNAPK